MSKRQEIRKKPVLPLWLAALAWPVGALVFPVYTLWGLAATAALSVVVYFVLPARSPTPPAARMWTPCWPASRRTWTPCTR